MSLFNFYLFIIAVSHVIKVDRVGDPEQNNCQALNT